MEPSLLGSGNCVPPTAQVASPEQAAQWEEERRKYEWAEKVRILQQAAEIKADPVLMTELRAFIRQHRDQLAQLLDEIGG